MFEKTGAFRHCLSLSRGLPLLHGTRGFKKLSEFSNSSLQGHESSQNTCFTQDCVSCGIADCRCCTPTSSRKYGLSQSKDMPTKRALQKKLASEAYRAIGGVARNSIANYAIVGH